MRSRRRLRGSRPVHAAAGLMLLTAPTTAVALAAGQADAQSAVQMNLSSGHIGLGRRVTVSGTAPSGTAGQEVLIEFARAGSHTWQTLGSTKIAADGGFGYAARLRESGLLRAVMSAGSSPRVAALSTAPSTPRPLTVGSRLELRRRTIDLLGGQQARVRGRLLPGTAGRTVRLEGRMGRRWRVLASTRTGSHGQFAIRYRPHGSAGGARGEQLRVAFHGDDLNTGSAGSAGKLTVFTESVASWYNDGGATACGFHAGDGVANRSLPCGTKVTFRHGSHRVTAVVDDRGPYVGGREWDLNQNTAAALGFAGVGTVWSAS